MEEVEKHYSHGQLEQAILRALEGAGKHSERLSQDDLAPIDEFHIRGRAATRELAQAIGLDSDMTVLDVGCGLGGPARRLASEYGCRVTGLDLTDEYCRGAQSLSARLGLQDLVSCQTGNADAGRGAMTCPVEPLPGVFCPGGPAVLPGQFRSGMFSVDGVR